MNCFQNIKLEPKHTEEEDIHGQSIRSQENEPCSVEESADLKRKPVPAGEEIRIDDETISGNPRSD